MAVTTEVQQGVSVVTVTGDLDVATAPEVEEALTADGRVLADLCGVDFIDSYGLRTLLQRQRRADSEGEVFAIACPEDSALARLLELVGTAGVFTLHSSREEALAALAAA
jgi:anti-sigma B factor antagonist